MNFLHACICSLKNRALLEHLNTSGRDLIPQAACAVPWLGLSSPACFLTTERTFTALLVFQDLLWGSNEIICVKRL